ncbi:hypothetical protein NS212_09825 [Pseudomonas parafulva]|uniref:Uncharacterized protein n=1 Tax=Pseudomonas parafulva TaxID=157782 RepID=A0AAJ0LID2_9PSED|nr:hypothetical protein NS212_09825 [Pseudomonas parafulva]KTT16661.1 hypothetical protein NS96R_15075 [Pseudomonas parafulva]
MITSSHYALRVRIPMGYRNSTRIDCADLGEGCKGKIRSHPIIRIDGIRVCNEMLLQDRGD